MKTLASFLVLGACSTGFASAQQVVLDFDDLVGSAAIPAGYGGVAHWANWEYSDAPDLIYPAASGAVKIFSNGPPDRIQFGQDVIFEGSNIVTAQWFSWVMYYQGNEVAWSGTIAPNVPGPPVWLASHYTGLVDEVGFHTWANVHGIDDFTFSIPAARVGINFCTPNVNSTGVAGSISAMGSTTVAANDLTLTASDIPVGQFGLFVVGDAVGTVVVNEGILCVGGAIGRYQRAGQIQHADANGRFSLSIDLTMIPQPDSFIAAQSGDTLYFQAWHRDVNVASDTSNFTDGLQVDFQ